MNWYCRFENRQLGPLTAAQLKALAQRGEIDDRWQVRREIDEKWLPATQIQGLPIKRSVAGPTSNSGGGAPRPQASVPAAPSQGAAARPPAKASVPRGVEPSAKPPMLTAMVAVPVPTHPSDPAPPPAASPSRTKKVAIIAAAAAAVGLVIVAAVMFVPRLFGPGGPPATVASTTGIAATNEPPSITLPVNELGTRFRDVVPAEAFLVGFEATLSSADPDAVVTSVRPIFRQGEVETRGAVHGMAGPQAVEVKAPAGLAVGGLKATGGLTRNGFSMHMMTIVDGHLDPEAASNYVSIGREPDAEADEIGLGLRVDAVFGRTDENGLIGMGLEFAAPAIAAPDPWSEIPEVVPLDESGNRTKSTGGYGTGMSAGSADGPILAVEFGLIEWFGRDVIGAIYAVGEKQKGSRPNWNWDRTTRIDARPGYALSAIRVYGERNADGARVTFSRLKEGSLDHSDRYDVGPIGDVDSGRVLLLSSRGRIVNGIDTFQKNGRATAFLLKLDPTTDGAASSAIAAAPPRKQSPEEVEAAHGPAGPAANLVAPEIQGRSIARKNWTKVWDSQWSRPLYGVEVGLKKRDGRDVICGFRLIVGGFQGGVRERNWRWIGAPGTRQVRVEAREGYALSAVRLFGQDGLSGLQPTFSRIVGDRLDIQDGYNAETIGTADATHYAQLSGQGRIVSGLNGTFGDGRIQNLNLRFLELKPPK